MIRERFHIYTNDLEGWDTIIESFVEYNGFAEGKGWPRADLWTLVAGPIAEIVAESEYADLNEYKRMTDEFYADPEAKVIFKRFMDTVAVERSWTELLMPATPVG